jgi:outer membrane protein assembly factor BamB
MGGVLDPRLRRRLLLRVLPTVAVLAVLTAIAVPVVRHSDAATTTSVVAPAPPPGLHDGSLPATVRALWSAPLPASAPATGAVADGATVVVADSAGVSGRDARTGAQRWSYHRGNARLCAWTIRDHVVVASFGKAHGCTDLTALDAGTGARRWYRNADLGRQVDLSSAPGVVVARSDDQLLAVDTATGLNRWATSKPGCRYDPVLVGNLGAVAVLHCATSTTIVSHDTYADSQRWSVPAAGSDPVLLAVTDAQAAVLTGDRPRTLTLYDAGGHRVAQTTDARLAGPDRPGWPAGISAGGLLVVWTGERAVAVDPAGARVRWDVPATGPPVVDSGQVLVPAATGYLDVAPATGAVARRAAGPAPPRGALLSRIGRLVAAVGGGATAVYG